jgi:hypothetical protein
LKRKRAWSRTSPSRYYRKHRMLPETGLKIPEHVRLLGSTQLAVIEHKKHLLLKVTLSKKSIASTPTTVHHTDRTRAADYGKKQSVVRGGGSRYFPVFAMVGAMCPPTVWLYQDDFCRLMFVVDVMRMSVRMCCLSMVMHVFVNKIYLL